MYSEWNSMDDSEGAITAVIINMHGNQTVLALDNRKHIDFSKLKNKNIDTLLSLACYNGSYKNGIAKNVITYLMENNIIKQAIAPTRTVSGDRRGILEQRTKYESDGPGFFRYTKTDTGEIIRIDITPTKNYAYKNIVMIFKQAEIYNRY